MPDAAYLEATLTCPLCSVTVTDIVVLQWGYCPSRLPDDRYVYHIGDSIIWKSCSDGSIPTWTYFYDGDWQNAQGANIGDPAYTNLIVTNQEFGNLGRNNSPEHPWNCPSCSKLIKGTAVEIRDGQIQRAWIYLPGEFTEEASIYLIEVGETFRPMLEWDDHAMQFLEC